MPAINPGIAVCTGGTELRVKTILGNFIVSVLTSAAMNNQVLLKQSAH